LALLVLGLALTAVPASAATPSAARLLRLDPGARIGGDTEVATEPGSTVRGVSGRTNFIDALGARERIYRASCDSVSGSDCPVTFASRSLKGFWANEFVPAYQCPGDYPYLIEQNYAPFGTSLLSGVEVRGLGPIGVSISRERSINGPDGKITYSAGTYSHNLGGSSATSWSLGENSYQVVLHCTNDANRGHATSGGGQAL
jgi:hypothetical protein